MFEISQDRFQTCQSSISPPSFHSLLCGSHGSTANVQRSRPSSYCCRSTSTSCQMNSTVGLYKSPITGVFSPPGRVRCLSLLQPTAEGTLVNHVTRGKMWPVEAFEVLIAMVKDVGTEHEKGCGLLRIDLGLWLEFHSRSRGKATCGDRSASAWEEDLYEFVHNLVEALSLSR